jgi:hypothetical protein
MLTSQDASREICEHYYPALARDMLRHNGYVTARQAVFVLENPAYNVYEDRKFGDEMRENVLYYFINPLELSKHETVNLMLLIFYGYPEVSDVCWPDQKLPKDSLNRLFILLERYNKAIKRRLDLNMKKILRGIVLKDAPLVEIDVEQIPLTE